MSLRPPAAMLTALLVFSLSADRAAGETPKHSFTLGATDFLIDGKPFQIIAGEMHRARIPSEYWQHRIRMAKAMGCNTIAAYVFWNYHEIAEGVLDFSGGNRDIARFIRLAGKRGSRSC
jgi:beta-galactosidase